MKNWKAIASGNGLNLTDEYLERISPPLDAIEAVFRPLVAVIPHEIEPATTLSEAAVESK